MNEFEQWWTEKMQPEMGKLAIPALCLAFKEVAKKAWSEGYYEGYGEGYNEGRN